MITLRLEKDLEKTIVSFAKNNGLSKSELVRKSVVEFISKSQSADPYESGLEYFEKHSSDNPNLAKDSKKILHALFKGKK